MKLWYSSRKGDSSLGRTQLFGQPISPLTPGLMPSKDRCHSNAIAHEMITLQLSCTSSTNCAGQRATKPTVDRKTTLGDELRRDRNVSIKIGPPAQTGCEFIRTVCKGSLLAICTDCWNPWVSRVSVNYKSSAEPRSGVSDLTRAHVRWNWILHLTMKCLEAKCFCKVAGMVQARCGGRKLLKFSILVINPCILIVS